MTVHQADFTAAPLAPNKSDISAHLYALFDPAFVQAYPDSWIEIAYGDPAVDGGKPNKAENFSPFKLEEAVEFAVAKNAAGCNIYVSATLGHGDHAVTASHAWAEYDGAGDDERIANLLKANSLTPSIVVTAGTIPHPRRHLYFRLDGTVTPERLEAAGAALCALLGSNAVQDPRRVMCLAGSVNYPTLDEQAKGCVAELVALYQNPGAGAYSIPGAIRRPGADTPNKTDIAAHKVSFTFLRNKSGSSFAVQAVTLPELRDMILLAKAGTKEDLPWLKGARFGDKRTEAGSLRHDANVIGFDAIELDYDKMVLSFDQAVATLKAMNVRARTRSAKMESVQQSGVLRYFTY
uniref:hypothetical protein n=1 Tax=Bradyrhizobium sp. TaxID=376 RepID=UPI0025C0ADB7